MTSDEPQHRVRLLWDSLPHPTPYLRVEFEHSIHLVYLIIFTQVYL